jgi:hypothetical protein
MYSVMKLQMSRLRNSLEKEKRPAWTSELGERIYEMDLLNWLTR